MYGAKSYARSNINFRSLFKGLFEVTVSHVYTLNKM